MQSLLVLALALRCLALPLSRLFPPFLRPARISDVARIVRRRLDIKVRTGGASQLFPDGKYGVTSGHRQARPRSL